MVPHSAPPQSATLTRDRPFSVSLEVNRCPWHVDHRLVRIGLKGKEIAANKRPPSNLVFLVDVSGSMASNNKLPLVKKGLEMLALQMTEGDRVAIVTYSDTAALRLEALGALHQRVEAGDELRRRRRPEPRHLAEQAQQRRPACRQTKHLAHHRLDASPAIARASERALELEDQLVGAGVDHALQQRVLGREVVEDRLLAHAEAGGQRVERRRPIAP